MKAISLKQPWASRIAQGNKMIETRRWATEYRGELLIVSSKKPKIEGYLTGHALCVARLVDCRPMTKIDEYAAKCVWYRGAFAWVLEDIRPIEPFPVRGQLGLYDVDDDLIEMDCRNCNGISAGCEIDGLCFK